MREKKIGEGREIPLVVQWGGIRKKCLMFDVLFRNTHTQIRINSIFFFVLVKENAVFKKRIKKSIKEIESFDEGAFEFFSRKSFLLRKKKRILCIPGLSYCVFCTKM